VAINTIFLPAEAKNEESFKGTNNNKKLGAVMRLGYHFIRVLPYSFFNQSKTFSLGNKGAQQKQN
jgi:hypothetical protein